MLSKKRLGWLASMACALGCTPYLPEVAVWRDPSIAHDGPATEVHIYEQGLMRSTAARLGPKPESCNTQANHRGRCTLDQGLKVQWSVDHCYNREDGQHLESQHKCKP